MTDADPVNPMRIFYELSQRLPANAIVASRLRQRGQLVRPAPEDSRRGVRGSLSGTLATMGPGVPVRDRREVGAPRPARRSRSSATARCR